MGEGSTLSFHACSSSLIGAANKLSKASRASVQSVSQRTASLQATRMSFTNQPSPGLSSPETSDGLKPKRGFRRLRLRRVATPPDGSSRPASSGVNSIRLAAEEQKTATANADKERVMSSVLDKANETAMSHQGAVGSLPCTAVPPPPSPPLSSPWMETRALETPTCRVAHADMDERQLLIRMRFGDIGRDAKDANFPFSPECERAVATFLNSSMLHVALAALAAACPFLSGIYMAPWACAALVVGSLLVVGHLAFGGRLTARLGATLLVAGYGLNLVYVWAVVDATQLIERMDEIESKPLAIIAGVVSFGAWLGAQPSDYLSPKLKLRAAAILTALAAARSIIVWVRPGRYIAEIALCAGQFNIGVLVAMYMEFR